MNVMIRRIEARDETRWRELWDQYTRFYEREPREAITRQTWARIFDDRSPIHAIVATVAELQSLPGESNREYVVGIANYIIHDSTSALTPVCYLQDLFVDPDNRAAGLGRSLIDWLIAEMERQSWSRIYWQTRENNYRARGLYDKYTPHSGFVRYVIDNPLT